MEFTPFPKVPRLMRTISISEKIDGTNASIWIGPLDEDTFDGHLIAPAGMSTCIAIWDQDGGPYGMRAASRKRWVTPGKGRDNAGFASWVLEHVDDLKKLGPGHHFGEWWGKGIQRNYGLDEKRFSLFNPRWLDEGPDCVSVVPQLWTCEWFDITGIRLTLEALRRDGSAASPGFMNPEGIMIYHHSANQLFKFTFGGDGHKGV